MSTDHTWSGPGRALQVHLDLFEEAHREQTLFNSAARVSAVSLPKLVRWVDFAKTYSRSPLIIDKVTGKVTGGERFVGVTYEGQSKLNTVAPGLYDGRSNSEMQNLSIPDNDERLKTTAQMMWLTEYDLLNEAGTYYVSAEMMALVSDAADLSEPEPIFLTDLMEPSGFIVLEEPMIIPDLHPMTGEMIENLMPLRAIGWRRQEIGKRDGSGRTDGLVLICYDDAKSYNEIYIPEIERIAPELKSDGHLDIPMAVTEFHPWAFGTEWSSVIDITQTGQGKVISSAAYLRRWFLALNRLMWQRLLVPERWHPNRAGYRQFERVRGKEAPQATVLHLRRIVDNGQWRKKEDPDAWVSWPYPYRTPVRTHTRDQYFPSLGPARNEDGSRNPESHRRIFILKHWRGPDHLPTQDRYEVTAVVR